MTVDAFDLPVQYDTNGTTGPWTVPFYFLLNGDLLVIHTSATGVDATLSLTVDYTVTGEGTGNGTITTATAYAAGGVITIDLDMAIEQQTDYVETDSFPAESHERALDRVTLITGQLARVVGTTLRFPRSSAEIDPFPDVATRASRVIGFDAAGALAMVVPASGSATDLALQLASYTTAIQGSGLVGYSSAVAYAYHTIGWKLAESKSVRDKGALGLTSENATALVQAALDEAIGDSLSGNSLLFPDGDYRCDSITVNVDDVTTSTAGRVSLRGYGSASNITMRSFPNQDVFDVIGTGSFGFDMTGLRFGVASQGTNAAAVQTGNSATMLDFQIRDNYLNGIPIGFEGQFVSGQFIANLFDFMPQYGIHGTSKEFRKLEIVANHFYKVGVRALYVEGQFRSNGSPTLQADRDGGTGAGHFTYTANGHDRIFSNTLTQQNVYVTSADNFVIGNNWHNGRTPASTDYPLDALRLFDCTNFVISAEIMRVFSRGIYLEGCSNFTIQGAHIAEGNLAASASVGALTLITCSDFDANVNIINSGGTGIYLDGCFDFSLTGRVTNSWFSGVVIDDCLRGDVTIATVDANQADSATASQTHGISVIGASAGIILENCTSYVTNVAQGQKTNIHFDSTVSQSRINGGNVLSVRTAGLAIDDQTAGKVIVKRGIRGWTTKARGNVTVTNPATTAVVTHGMSETPAIEAIQANLINGVAAGFASWSIGTVTSTQFTLTLNATPTVSAQFAWFIDTEL